MCVYVGVSHFVIVCGSVHGLLYLLSIILGLYFNISDVNDVSSVSIRRCKFRLEISCGMLIFIHEKSPISYGITRSFTWKNPR